MHITMDGRPYCFMQRVAVTHTTESVLFPIDTSYNYHLYEIYEKHNEYSAKCQALEEFEPGAVDIAHNTITLTGLWAIGASVIFRSTGILPSPLIADKVYYIVHNVTNKIQVSTAYNGIPVDLTSTGSGMHTIHAAMSPDVQVKIYHISSGMPAMIDAIHCGLITTPSYNGVGVYDAPAPYNMELYGVNYTASPRKRSIHTDMYFRAGDSIQLMLTGQHVIDTSNPLANLPSYIDIMLVGRYYPLSAR